jgi:hypothetical protein
MTDIRQKSEEIGWADGRFRLFGIAVSLFIAIIFVLVCVTFDAGNLTPIGGLIFGVMTLLIEPSKPPHLKDRIAKIILGQAAFITDYAFIWKKRSVKINISNPEGDASILREHVLKNRDERNIKNRQHHFAFSSDTSGTDPRMKQIDGGYIECSSNGNELSKRTIAKSDNYYEFILNFSSSVEPGDTYDYDIDLKQVKNAYPNSDNTHSWQIRSYTSIRRFDIVINYQFDTTIYAGELTDVQTGEDISSVDIDSESGLIQADVESLPPGHYKLEWSVAEN